MRGVRGGNANVSEGARSRTTITSGIRRNRPCETTDRAVPPIWTAGGSRHPDSVRPLQAEEQTCHGQVSSG
jgi:hypothetical protein